MIGNKIKDLRNQRKMTQSDLGDLLGVSGKTIGAWERGTREPSIDMINQLAETFGVSADYLLGRPQKGKTDLLSSIKSARTFGGKRYDDEDAEAIADIVSAYLKHKK